MQAMGMCGGSGRTDWGGAYFQVALLDICGPLGNWPSARDSTPRSSDVGPSPPCVYAIYSLNSMDVFWGPSSEPLGTGNLWRRAWPPFHLAGALFALTSCILTERQTSKLSGEADNLMGIKMSMCFFLQSSKLWMIPWGGTRQRMLYSPQKRPIFPCPLLIWCSS